MTLTNPKMRSITGKLTPNKLTEREDDFTFNVIYQANQINKRSLPIAAINNKFFCIGT